MDGGMDTKFWLHCFRLSFILVKRLFNIGDCISSMVFVSLTVILVSFLLPFRCFLTNWKGICHKLPWCYLQFEERCYIKTACF